jgi:3-oxoacyl-[acyl-carrier-protein] synthase-3
MEVINESLAANGYTADDWRRCRIRQHLRISDYVRHQMNLPEAKVFSNIQWYGNTTAASIPIALTEASSIRGG